MGHRMALAASLVAVAPLLAETGCGSTSAGAGGADGSAEAATVVADARSDVAVACTNGYDCSGLFFSESSSESQTSVPCCTNKVCGLEPYDECTDATAQLIQAANYDQSCMTDTDCVAVAEGDFCSPGAGNCPNAAISKSAYAQYQADTAKTRAASCYAPGNCGTEPGPCCVAGRCHFDSQCFDASPLADAATHGGLADADACAPSSCATACPAGTHDVSSVVNGCTVWQCCVSDDGAGPDAATDAAVDANAE